MNNQEIDDRIKTKFEVAYAKQMRIIRKTLFPFFTIMGLFFLLIGIIAVVDLFIDTPTADLIGTAICCLVFGLFVIGFGIIIYVRAGRKVNYAKIYARSEKHGLRNLLLLDAVVAVQAEQIQDLEARLAQLEQKAK